jgi:hypothetical protein
VSLFVLGLDGLGGGLVENSRVGEVLGDYGLRLGVWRVLFQRGRVVFRA